MDRRVVEEAGELNSLLSRRIRKAEMTLGSAGLAARATKDRRGVEAAGELRKTSIDMSVDAARRSACATKDRRAVDDAGELRKTSIDTSVDAARLSACATILIALILAGCGGSAENNMRRALATQVTGTIHLPPGVFEIDSEMHLAPGAHDLEIIGTGTILKASDEFHGRAVIVAESANRIALRNISIQGSRRAILRPLEMAPPENAFRVYYSGNGVLFDQVDGLELTELHFTAISGFAILVSRSSGIQITRTQVDDSGSHNGKGRNNTTGGIVIEEGSSNFEVRDCVMRRIAGNGIWTHSLFTSPRLHDGLITHNRFETIGRDAIEIGHATRVRVEENTGAHIGFPVEVVDIENGGTPVTVDTAGNVDQSLYLRNKFEDINGKCIDLDGFHDGSVRENECVSRRAPIDYPSGHFGIVMNNTDPNAEPVNVEIANNVVDGTKYGALFLMGSHNRITGNTFMHINMAECHENASQFGCVYKPDEPKMLESGIYLGRGVARMTETRGNVIRGNKVSGHKMKSRCIAAGPGVSLTANSIEGNKCEDYSTKR
jgi:hypothetical protein